MVSNLTELFESQDALTGPRNLYLFCIEISFTAYANGKLKTERQTT